VLNEDSDPRRDDSWLAEETAAAMRDFAHTVTEAPPLRLAAGFSSAGTRRRTPGTRRWWTWLAPVSAAAAVAALAVAPVVIRDMPPGGAETVPVSVGVVPTANSTVANPGTSGTGGTPRYYAAIQHKTITSPGKPPEGTTVLTLGDSLTGETLAVIGAPSGVKLLNVAAAADDRTFVVAGRADSGGSTVIKLYKTYLELGRPSTMTLLPITPQPVGYAKSVLMIGDTFPVALSSSGTELALSEFSGTSGLAVKVFSVATGRLLRQWTTTDPSLALPGLAMTPTLTWIDDDRALALATVGQATRSGKVYVQRQTVRRLDLDGPASGDLIADSTVLRNVQLGGNNPCGVFLNRPSVISADGKTFTCSTDSSFVTYPLGAGAAGARPGRVDLSIRDANFVSVPLWASAAGDTIIAEWQVLSDGNAQANGKSALIAVISHGQVTPLRFPNGFVQVLGGAIAW